MDDVVDGVWGWKKEWGEWRAKEEKVERCEEGRGEVWNEIAMRWKGTNAANEDERLVTEEKQRREEGKVSFIVARMVL